MAGSQVFRPGREDDLDTCTRVWGAAIEEYQGRLGQPPMGDDLAPLRRLLAHTLAADPGRFWVAVDGEGSVMGFSSATLREGLWFLAMLYVRPGSQAAGVGQALMDRAQAGRDVDPGGPAVPGPDDPLDSGIHTWGMCTDAAQPISNALYARRGIVPRIPAWRMIGEVRRWSAVPPLPASLEAVPFERVEGGGPEGPLRLADAVDGRVHGYVYGSGGGRLGPVAALDPELHASLIGVAVRDTPMLGAVGMWVPGSADRATRALLDAGLRFDGIPGLVCWSRGDHPFERYLPISLALV
jgi:GNAT superfamily N-acetyltransferase